MLKSQTPPTQISALSGLGFGSCEAFGSLQFSRPSILSNSPLARRRRRAPVSSQPAAAPGGEALGGKLSHAVIEAASAIRGAGISSGFRQAVSLRTVRASERCLKLDKSCSQAKQKKQTSKTGRRSARWREMQVGQRHPGGHLEFAQATNPAQGGVGRAGDLYADRPPRSQAQRLARRIRGESDTPRHAPRRSVAQHLRPHAVQKVEVLPNVGRQIELHPGGRSCPTSLSGLAA